MSDEEKKRNSLIHVHVEDALGLSKPATTLINKIGNAIGKVYEPWHTVRQAKADAKAELYAAQIRREMTAEEEAFESRANNRKFAENLREQHNIESTIGKAVKELPPDTPEDSVNNMDDDWIVRVLWEIGMVSDESMQTLWAKILAGEAGKSGSFSKRTVRIVADMSKEDAEMFTHFCQFVANDKPKIYDTQTSVYNTRWRMFDILTHLNAAGLITAEKSPGYETLCQFSIQIWYYYDRYIRLNVPKKGGKYSIKSGHALFTEAGKQLLPICGAQPSEKFFSYLMEKWKEFGYNPTLLSEQEAVALMVEIRKQESAL